MNKLEKDFLHAWLLGMVLPAVILGTFLLITDSDEDADMLVGQTTPQITFAPPKVVIPVLSEDGTVTEMELENYLCGVVLAEMPADFEVEALKAQSVVARTYALRRLEQGTKHGSGAVCTDPACCQGYISQDRFILLGGSQSGVSKVSRAVLETAGEVLLYDGKLIDATYFSCSGGMTEDAVAVWGNDVPYLQSTFSPGEENATHYSDSLSLDRDTVERALDVSLTGDAEDWFTILSLTDGGGVDELEVCGKRFSGVEIRRLLDLRSTNFTVTATENEIIFHTKGYGHRVGMSQYGADAMAREGRSYSQILTHYYHGTTLAQYLTGD
jgi:stage II sporulation protein D